MPVTINDVARLAGVSTSTVSKVINNWSTISQQTVDKVNEAIKALNYTPNARAVNFARQSTKNIIFLTSLGKDEAYHNPHMFDIMCGAYKALNDSHYTMTLVDISEDKVQGESVSRVISQKCADGLIIHGSAINKGIASLIVQKQFPHMIIGHPGFESQLCWVDTNHSLAGKYAAEHLLERGYKDIAFIGGKKTDIISVQRERGFKNAMLEAGISVSGDRIIYTDSSKEDSYAQTLKMLSGKKPPRAVVCENNFIAVGVMNAIHKLNLNIPKEIAFVTFDRYPYSKMIEPTPTVVDINVYDMGIQAGVMLLRKLENPSLLVQSYTTLPMISVNETT